MNANLRSILRASTLVTASITFAALSSTAAMAAPTEKATSAEIDVTHACTTVDITSTKDLSNVVLLFTDGTKQRFEGLSSEQGEFAGTGEHDGSVISTVWVKSGANFSDDGPGYGERFDLSTEGCDEPQEPEDSADDTPAATPTRDDREDESDDNDNDDTTTSNDDEKPGDDTPADAPEGTDEDTGDADESEGPADADAGTTAASTDDDQSSAPAAASAAGGTAAPAPTAGPDRSTTVLDSTLTNGLVAAGDVQDATTVQAAADALPRAGSQHTTIVIALALLALVLGGGALGATRRTA